MFRRLRANTILVAACLCCLVPLRAGSAPAGSLCLNEVVSFNDSGLTDEDGDHPDWIELFNGGSQGLNLRGYGLSDDAGQPFKWIFPLRVVPAGGFLVVYASGKDRTNGMNLHTSFALNSEGESVVLTRPDGARLDAWTLSAAARDFSFGRKPDGGTNRVYFGAPTPGSANAGKGFSDFAGPPSFSRAGGAYDAGFPLALDSAEPEAAIFYTLDGSEPATNSLLYTAAIGIRDRSGEPNVLSLIPGTATVNQHTDGWFPPNGLVRKSTVVRARVFRPNAWPSPVLTHTYFVGPTAAPQLGLPVISLAINTNDLFDYRTGIYVLGKTFDDYRAAYPNEPLTGHTPANYTQRGPAWERRAHFEFFEPGGTLGFAQNVLVDIQGQSSRSFRQKSLGIKARSDLAPRDTVAYEVWPGLTNRAGVPLTAFPNLRLSNSGNDWTYTLFRDALCHRLAQPTPVDLLAYRPAVVFLDGEYWGIHNLREQMDSGFLANHYGVSPSQVVICETIGTVIEGAPGDNAPYLSLRSWVETNDLTRATNYAWVNRQMDVQNFIAYQAAEIYFANADWPHNNIRYWRLRTPEYQPAAPYGHDGRWRWLLFDVDLGYGHPWSGGYGDNTLAAALNPSGRPGVNAPWSTVLFRRLLLNPKFRNEFINTLADHLNSSYQENRAVGLADEIQRTLSAAMPEHIRRWRTAGDSMLTWSNNVRVLRTFASQRPINCRQHVVTQFGLAGYATVTLNVAPVNRGHLRINTLILDAKTPGVTTTAVYPWRGTYFKGVPVQLQALPAPGYAFAGWSNRLDLGLQETLTVSLSNNVSYTAMFERAPSPHDLRAGPYRLTSWSADAQAGVYPPHARFTQTALKDPGLDTPMEDDWRLPYNLTNRSRINGLGDDGIGFLDTSGVQEVPGAGYVGSMVLAVRTVGLTNVAVSWVGGTVAPNQQVCGLRLQYAVGDGPFQDVADSAGHAVEYARHSIAGHEQVIGPVILPAAANDQPYVQLRWRYYVGAGGNGPRAQLRLDDVLVTAGAETSPGRFTRVRLLPTGELELGVDGSPHRTYAFETSIDLARWQTLETFTFAVDGRREWRRQPMTSEPIRFYRLRSL